MKDVVLKYLETHYKFTISTYNQYRLYDNDRKIDIGLRDTLSELNIIFGVPFKDLEDIIEEWANAKEVIINNLLVDIKTKIYKETGVKVEPDNEESATAALSKSVSAAAQLSEYRS